MALFLEALESPEHILATGLLQEGDLIVYLLKLCLLHRKLLSPGLQPRSLLLKLLEALYRRAVLPEKHLERIGVQESIELATLRGGVSGDSRNLPLREHAQSDEAPNIQRHRLGIRRVRIAFYGGLGLGATDAVAPLCRDDIHLDRMAGKEGPGSLAVVTLRLDTENALDAFSGLDTAFAGEVLRARPV